MPDPSLTAPDRAILQGATFAHFATLDEDGSSHVTPVWIDVDEQGNVLVNSAVGRRKDRNIRRDPRVALSASPADDPYRWVVGAGDRHVDRDRRGGRGAHLRAVAALPGKRLRLHAGAGSRDLPDPPRCRHPLGVAVADVPLAARMRPRTFEEYEGQGHLVGEGTALSSLLAGGNLPSIILWGPAGTGKTTLAHLLADAVGADLIQLSAVSSGVADARKVMQGAKGGMFRTVLFVDEVHRWSKAQQDVLLPSVEEGTITLIGATTENPYFSLNTPLLSRCMLLRLEPLSDEDVVTLMRRALADEDRGLGGLHVSIADDALAHLVSVAGGDARVGLTGLEAAALAATQAGQDEITRSSPPTRCRRRRSCTTARATRTTT